MPVGKSGSLHILVSVYSELCGTQRVESLKCRNEFTFKVYGYQLHNGQLRQSYVGLVSSILSYVGFDTDMPGIMRFHYFQDDKLYCEIPKWAEAFISHISKYIFYFAN